jgi:hypothetical protein
MRTPWLLCLGVVFGVSAALGADTGARVAKGDFEARSVGSYSVRVLSVLVSAGLVVAADYPTVVVDEAHIGFSRADASEPPPYVIAPAAGVVILASDYQIAVPKEFGVPGPNSIHLVMGNNGKYKIPWRGNGHRHELSAATLRPLPGSVAFRGFRSGDTAIIAIGFDHTGITPGKDNVLSAMWLGMIKVR